MPFSGSMVRYVTTAIGVLLAFYLGIIIGGGEARNLIPIGAVGGVVFFALYLHRYAWQLALLFIFTNFIYRPAGFAIGSTELSSAIGVAVVLIYVWQKRTVKRPALLNETGFPLMLKMLFAWLAYVGLHLIYNVKIPYRPVDFALNNALKSYFGVIAPYFLLLYFALAPAGIMVKRSFFWTITKLCLFGLLLSLGLRAYEIARGTTYVVIPGINAIDNLYTLRGIGPFSVLIGVVGRLSRDWSNRAAFQRVCFYLLIVLGAFGTLLSGGRASLVIAFFSACGALFLQRKIGALLVIGALGLMTVVVANVGSGWVNKRANPFVQRSLQWILLEKSESSEETIDSSTRWRRELARRTLNEWKSDPRILWFGRATYGYGTADEIARDTQGGFEALLETALRRGATHNLITDFLIAYGLVGCTLYLLLYLSIIRFLWKLRRQRSLAPATASLVLVCLTGSTINLFFGIIAGGNFPVELLWCVIVIIAAVHGKYGLEASPELISPEVLRPLPQSGTPAWRQ